MSNSPANLQLIGRTRCAVGENPLWHAEEGSIYWCDIPNGLLLRYQLSSGEERQWKVGEQLGGFTIQADGNLLLFMNRGRVCLWRDEEVIPIIHELQDHRSTRFNDVIADPQGRVLCGAMSTPECPGRLYKLETDGSLHVLLEGIGCSNGLAFSQDFTELFHTDSLAREIYRYTYNVAHGTLSNRRLFASLTAEEGLPDGATMDAEGFLWSARWGGGCVARYAMDGSVDRVIALPVNKAASLTFGGTSLNEMFISTANVEEADSAAGALFRCEVGVRGIAECRSRVRI